MPRNLSWNFNFTPLRDADSINSGSSRAWGDLGSNIDALTKKMQKWSSDPYDKQFKENFAKLSPEEQLAIMQRGDFIPTEYVNKVSPEMLDKYRLTDPSQSLQWQNALAQMQQQKQNAEIQRYGFGRTQLKDNREDALRAFDQAEFAHKRAVDEAIASGDRIRLNQALNAQNDFRQQAMNANPNVHVNPLSHKSVLDASNAYNLAELTWSTNEENKAIKSSATDLLGRLKDSDFGSDSTNTIANWVDEAESPEDRVIRTRAVQELQANRMIETSPSALRDLAGRQYEAEEAAFYGGASVGSGNPVAQSAVNTAVEGGGLPGLTRTNSVPEGWNKAINPTPLNKQNLPPLNGLHGMYNPMNKAGEALWEEQYAKQLKAQKESKSILDSAVFEKSAPKHSEDLMLAKDFSEAWKRGDSATVNAIAEKATGVKPSGVQDYITNHLKPLYFSAPNATVNVERVKKSFPSLASIDLSQVGIAPDIVAKHKGKRAGIDREAYAKGIRVTDSPFNMTYGRLPTTIPYSEMTLGQIVDKLYPDQVAVTKADPKLQRKDKNGNFVGSSAGGLGQMMKATVEDLAPKLFGPDWKNRVNTPEVQELLLRARFDQAAKMSEVPSVVWEGLKSYKGQKGFEWVSEKGGFKDKNYKDIRPLILAKESKNVPDPFDKSSQQKQTDYVAELPKQTEIFHQSMQEAFGGGPSSVVEKYKKLGRDNRDAQVIVNEIVGANKTYKTSEKETLNSLGIKPPQLTDLINSTKADLAKEGIVATNAQIAHVVLENLKRRERSFGALGDWLFGKSDELDVNSETLFNTMKLLDKNSKSDEYSRMKEIESNYTSLQTKDQQYRALDTHIKKLQRRVEEAGTDRGIKKQLDRAMKERAELAKMLTKEMSTISGKLGIGVITGTEHPSKT